MQLVLSFLTWLAPTLTGWAIAFFSRKIIVATTTIATFVLLTATFIVCIKGLITTLLAAMVLPGWVSGFLFMFIPSDFAIVLGSIMASHSCRWAYDMAVSKVQFINGAQ